MEKSFIHRRYYFDMNFDVDSKMIHRLGRIGLIVIPERIHRNYANGACCQKIWSIDTIICL